MGSWDQWNTSRLSAIPLVPIMPLVPMDEYNEPLPRLKQWKIFYVPMKSPYLRYISPTEYLWIEWNSIDTNHAIIGTNWGVECAPTQPEVIQNIQVPIMRSIFIMEYQWLSDILADSLYWTAFLQFVVCILPLVCSLNFIPGLQFDQVCSPQCQSTYHAKRNNNTYFQLTSDQHEEDNCLPSALKLLSK